ncbi:TetR family transcriptional regulator [Brevibacterium atlanticum]|uniref:TetR family transcriptional regulator n=1 Tax=Brevibacterium atlanticum TaxID=2697563 RepID=UPI0014231CDB|nr:TetR family transcriptional regulator [Brevibacterium atlanticum]
MALTAESITHTALDILSRYGLGDLSMRRLARELEVQPSALYWHVKDKQSLLVLISKNLKVEVDNVCPVTADPLAAAMSLREVLLKYRDGAEIVLLGYSIAAADVTPRALSSERLGAEVSQGILTLTLGAVAVEQNRRLFDIDPAGAAENFAANAAAMLVAVRSQS